MSNEECCTILGESVNLKKKWVTNVRKNMDGWIPMFLEYVDPEKCIGCGMCIKVCTGKCYELQEKNVNGKIKTVSVAIKPENCLGDCSCHLICPVKRGAMVCKPKVKNE